MKRHTLLLSFALVGIVLLSACTIQLVDFPPAPNDVVRTSDNDLEIVGEYDLAAGASILVQVNVATSRDLVFIELDQDFDLAIQVNNGTSVRTTLASSSSREYFASGLDGLGQASQSVASLAPQAINVPVACGGSCVALRAASHSRLFARITNTSGARQAVALFAFGRDLQDTNEGVNDSAAGAPPIAPGADVQGAIETLGDVDYWWVQADGEVAFTPNHPGVTLVVRIRDVLGGEFGPYFAGPDTFLVKSGDILWVEERNGRAAAAGLSYYTLSHTP